MFYSSFIFLLTTMSVPRLCSISGPMINDYGAVGVIRIGRETELIREYLPESRFAYHKSYMT
jgi:hypothetical protein